MLKFLTRTRRKGRVDITDILAWVWLIVGGVMVLIPVSWAVLSSFKEEAEIMRQPPSFIPVASEYVQVDGYEDKLPIYQVTDENGSKKEYAMVKRIGKYITLINPKDPNEKIRLEKDQAIQVKKFHIAWENYSDPLRKFNFATYLRNTVFVTVVATILTLLMSSMAAFALSKYEFKGKNITFLVIVSTLMIPLTVVMVPAFLVVSGLNLSDNLWGVILPTVATPTGVFLLRQYMLTIPDELIEAARVDAASEFRIFWRIILPLTAPALAVLAIFSVMWRWNDFLWPLIVLNSKENFTLQIGLNSFQGEFSVQWHYILAMTVLSLLPVTIIFTFLQKYITTGISGSGMK